jgi:hypothetical protein
MKRHDIKSVSAEQLWSFPETAASDRAESATLAANLRAQRQRFQRLNEFCDRAIAEIRASLERNQNEGDRGAVEQKGSVRNRRFASRPKSARAA